jgi:hypothetical protein
MCGYIVLSNRLNRVEDLEEQRYSEMAERAEPKELQRALTVAESSAARMDASALGLEKFKEQIHREMQRFYAIMRRTENSATLAAGKHEEEEVPTEIDPADLKRSATDGPKTKQELRAIAREKGILI